MTKQKLFLMIKSALCVLIAVLLSASAIRIYADGSAWQAAGHPSDWIFTREKAAAALMPILPLILLSIAMTVYGLVKGIKDENADKPVRDAALLRDMRSTRADTPAASGEENAAAKAGKRLHDTPEAVVRSRILLRRVLMAAAVLFIILGIVNGGMKDVLVKAIKICTECVGLG